MAIDKELRDLMVETITVEPWVAHASSDGRETYGAAVQIPARIESTSARVITASRTDPQAQERLATGRIYIPDTPIVRIEDRLTLPDGRKPVIVKVEANGDERGPHHQVIWI